MKYKHLTGTRGSAKHTNSLVVRYERSRPISQNISTVLTNKCTQLPCDNCLYLFVKTVYNELHNARNGKYKERKHLAIDSLIFSPAKFHNTRGEYLHVWNVTVSMRGNYNGNGKPNNIVRWRQPTFAEPQHTPSLGT